jgi:DNA invertase Pin-like site-specific DNA recombinase
MEFSRDVYGDEPVVFVDNGVSGMGPVGKGLQAVFKATEAGEIDVVLVSDLSRISRDSSRVSIFLDHLNSHGAELRCVAGDGTSKKVNPSTPVLDQITAEETLREVGKRSR